jgi:hypothetical protein
MRPISPLSFRAPVELLVVAAVLACGPSSDRVADRSTRTSSTTADSVAGRDPTHAPTSRSAVPDSPHHTNLGSLPPIGIVVVNSRTGACLTYDGQLTPGAELALLDVPVMAGGAASVRAARVGAARETPCKAVLPPTRPNERAYDVLVDGPPPEFGVVYFGVVAPAAHFSVTDDRVESDLDGDDTPERFRICTSMEGLHLTVWSGVPLASARRWHRYLYVGYDLEPTCEDREVPPPDSSAA